MSDSTEHKAHAVAIHHEDASLFADRYRRMQENAYDSTFTYGRKKIEVVIERELNGLAPGIKALDVGCGTGFNVSRLRERGFDVTGLEPAVGMRTEAQQNNPDCTITDGDIEAMPYESNSFDFILCIEVIRYMADQSKSLREIARVLKPGGTAIITAAPLLSLNGYALINTLTARVKIPTFSKVKHTFYTVAGAKQALADAGFASSEVHGAFLGGWHVLGRLAPSLLPPALRAWEPIDDMLSDLGPLKDLSNHLILVGRK